MLGHWFNYTLLLAGARAAPMAETSKQYLETGRQKSAIAKFWGVFYFKGDSDYVQPQTCIYLLK